MPGGPWAARGSAWGDTETTLWQGVGYSMGHGVARARPLPTVQPPSSDTAVHPRDSTGE